MKKNNINNSILLTNDASIRVKSMLAHESKRGYALRISVGSRDCFGINYSISFDNKIGEFDKVSNVMGVQVLCDFKSWLYLRGKTIDISDDMINGGFKIVSPSVDNGCECGVAINV
tara:strand:+ start:465 stop:812 length:348 start_codon:yes stop_codon:yes gene_type:complete